MAPRKSIYRQSGAQHFQLVHRSQRDPLIHDPDASPMVFREVERGNEVQKKKGQTLAELESQYKSTSNLTGIRENEGEASVYGVYFDDTSYDYMQHLREVGRSREAVFVSAPGQGSGAIGGGKSSGKGRGFRELDVIEDEDIQGVEGMFKKGGKGKERAVLPEEVLPSQRVLTKEQVYEAQSSIPLQLQGLQPDMNPHLRQVIEALEDEAFVDGEDEGDWFEELVKGGEMDEEDEPDWEFREEGFDSEAEDDDQREAIEGEEAKEESWEDRFKAFKKASSQSAPKGTQSEIDDFSEMGDTIGSLPAMSVIGAKKRRRKGTSDASGYSMSSSSMFRNKGLSTLDEMFDKVEADYERDSDEEEEEIEIPDDVSLSELLSNGDELDIDDTASTSTFTRMLRKQPHADPDVPPELSREDFDNIMDDFLENFEVVGKKMVPVLGGHTGAEKLDILRKALVEGDEEETLAGGRREDVEYIRERYLKERLAKEKEEEEAIPEVHIIGNREDRWDCETILSTYSSLENHPKLISSRNSKKQTESKARTASIPIVEEESSGSETETENFPSKVTVARPKNETKEDKKARKASVKAERAARRLEKKETQDMFGKERRKQVAQHQRSVANGKAADVAGKALQEKLSVLSLA